MPDTLRQILLDTRERLRFLQESGIDNPPNSPELEKFLAQEPVAEKPAAPAGAEPLSELHREPADCALCLLHQGRKLVVPGSGCGSSGLLLIEDQPLFRLRGKFHDFHGPPCRSPSIPAFCCVIPR